MLQALAPRPSSADMSPAPPCGSENMFQNKKQQYNMVKLWRIQTLEGRCEDQESQEKNNATRKEKYNKKKRCMGVDVERKY